jgi:hypothetical protein
MKYVTDSCHHHGWTTMYNASVDKIVRPCKGFHSRACRGQWQSHWMAAAAPPHRLSTIERRSGAEPGVRLRHLTLNLADP